MLEPLYVVQLVPILGQELPLLSQAQVGFVPLSLSAQSLRVTTIYGSSLLIQFKMTRGPASNITIHSLFFQNNKNSLTNKDFFILSVSTCIYSWRWNKRSLVSISSLLGSVPTPVPLLHPVQAWQESTRAYCCVFDEVYRRFNDWRHIKADIAHVCISPFVQGCNHAGPLHLATLSRFMINHACFHWLALEDKKTHVLQYKRRQ